jgi:hypothetical protein
MLVEEVGRELEGKGGWWALRLLLVSLSVILL